MCDVFIKKYWKEENILFYIHFKNGIAIRQIEAYSNGCLFLSLEEPYIRGAMLYDQYLEKSDLNSDEHYTEIADQLLKYAKGKAFEISA